MNICRQHCYLLLFLHLIEQKNNWCGIEGWIMDIFGCVNHWIVHISSFVIFIYSFPDIFHFYYGFLRFFLCRIGIKHASGLHKSQRKSMNKMSAWIGYCYWYANLIIKPYSYGKFMIGYFPFMWLGNRNAWICCVVSWRNMEKVITW